jgi:tRNA (adenine22-N1)-methyltransferase
MLTNQLGPRLSLVAKISKKFLKGSGTFVDMCCDHGQLGMEILRSDEIKVYFVDPISSIIKKLESKIDERHKERATCLTLKGQEFTFSEICPVIAICGVGGELIKEIVEKIIINNKQAKPIFILAPQNRPVELRASLSGLGFNGGEYILVEDNKKHYEVMTVSKDFKEPLSLIGKPAFNLNSSRDFSYLRKKREHYYLKTRKYPSFKSIVAEYDALLGEFRI